MGTVHQRMTGKMDKLKRCIPDSKNTNKIFNCPKKIWKEEISKIEAFLAAESLIEFFRYMSVVTKIESSDEYEKKKIKN